MQKSKLISLLKKFSKVDMKEFEKFISSPYFLKGRNLKPAFSQLKKYYPGFDSPGFNDESLFRKLNPKKKFDKKSSTHTIHVLFSELALLAEKFLVYNSFESGRFKYQYNMCLAELYRDNDYIELAKKTLMKNSELINKEDNNFDFYTKKLETNMSISGAYYTINKPKESYTYSRNNLLYIYAFTFDIINKYVNEYFVNKYSYNFEYKGFELVRLFTEAFDPILFDDECEGDEFETKNLTLINYYIIKSRLDETDKESLMNAVNIFIKIFDNLPRSTQWFSFALLFNRLFGRIRLDIDYLHKASSLIDFVWEKGVLSTHKKINLHLGSYHSALSVKAAADINGLRNFIERYAGKVDIESVNEVKEYSFAVLYFKDKLYGNALEKISKNDMLNFPALKINKHKLRICCLFELEFFEEALSAIDSLEHYLRKNKNVSEIVKTENLKFSSGVRKLIKIKLGSVSEPDIEFSKIIELTQNSIYGYWFREKVDLVS